MAALPADLVDLDSPDLLLKQVAMVNLTVIVESGDNILSVHDAMQLILSRVNSMDDSTRIQAVEVTDNSHHIIKFTIESLRL